MWAVSYTHLDVYKRQTIFLLSFTIIACSNDENFNTQEATVEFQSAEIEVNELTSILNLPIVVKGCLLYTSPPLPTAYKEIKKQIKRANELSHNSRNLLYK